MPNMIHTTAENDGPCEACGHPIKKGAKIAAEAKGPAWARYHAECAGGMKEAKKDSWVVVWLPSVSENPSIKKRFLSEKEAWDWVKAENLLDKVDSEEDIEVRKDTPIEEAKKPKVYDLDDPRFDDEEEHKLHNALGHEHKWGPVERSRFGGEPHRKCQVPFCKMVSLDLDTEDDAPVSEAKGDLWIASAIGEKGALRRKAARRGLIKGKETMSATDLEKLQSQAKKGKDTKTMRQVNLAKRLRGFNESLPHVERTISLREPSGLSEAFRLRPIGSNMNEVEIGPYTVLFSYQTPVAYHDGTNFYRTDTSFSPTTARHITKWLKDADAETVPQAEIEALVNNA